jgi:undecaprenyl-diphosphatase
MEPPQDASRSDHALAAWRAPRNLLAVVRRWRAAAPLPAAVRRLWLETSLLRAVLVILVLALLFAGYGLDEASAAWRRSLPPGLLDLFEVVTRFGKSDWVLFPTGIVVVLLMLADWRHVDRRLQAAWAQVGLLMAYVFAAVAVSGILTNIAKQLIGRARPIHFDELGWLALEPFRFDYGFASFPSGHATTAGALMVCGALLAPRLRLAFVAAALAISLSRVALGAHYPSDVIAGLALGGSVALALAFALARRNWGFTFTAAGGVRRKRLVLRRLLRRPGGLGRFLSAYPRALIGVRGGTPAPRS